MAALHEAAWQGNESMIRLLVTELGADVHALRGDTDATAVHSAAL